MSSDKGIGTQELKFTGGARIGRANATFPFATLKVSKKRLHLDVTIIGSLVFQASDIISIEPFYSLPIIGKGVKINHTVGNYQQHVVFWTFKDPEFLISQIYSTGFLDRNANIEREKEVLELQAQGGFPIKRSVAIAALILWNLLILSDFIPLLVSPSEGFRLGFGTFTALGILFIGALASMLSEDFRRFLLKEGYSSSSLRKFSVFALIISVFLLMQLAIVLLLQGE